MKRFIDSIYLKSSLQKKKLERLLAECGDETYWNYADSFADKFTKYLNSVGLSEDFAVDAYLKMCSDILNEQIKFLKTGMYSCSSVSDAYESVYSKEDVMRPYMIGVALSQFLWENHYKIYTFYLDIVNRTENKGIADYLEIGAGHGLFTAAAIENLKAKNYKVVDLSPISINICKNILGYLIHGNQVMPEFVEMNALDFKEDTQFDFITMGEVIEHVEDPKPLLQNISRLLKPQGKAFLTTCANSPAIDHIYLFHNVEEIRELFSNCGLEIVEEIILPIGKNEGSSIDNSLLGTSYAAVVKKAGC